MKYAFILRLWWSPLFLKTIGELYIVHFLANKMCILIFTNNVRGFCTFWFFFHFKLKQQVSSLELSDGFFTLTSFDMPRNNNICLAFFVSLEIFSLIWRRHHCR